MHVAARQPSALTYTHVRSHPRLSPCDPRSLDSSSPSILSSPRAKGGGEGSFLAILPTGSVLFAMKEEVEEAEGGGGGVGYSLEETGSPLGKLYSCSAPSVGSCS